MPIEYGSPAAFCAADNLFPGHLTEIALGHLHIGIRIQHAEHYLDFILEPPQNRLFRREIFLHAGNVFQIRDKRGIPGGRNLHVI